MCHSPQELVSLKLIHTPRLANDAQGCSKTWQYDTRRRLSGRPTCECPTSSQSIASYLSGKGRRQELPVYGRGAVSSYNMGSIPTAWRPKKKNRCTQALRKFSRTV
ncbi:hypothetical protein PspLS_01297 [Pyricularia sp. CBS 133598]|nr:hypothetical protein PspLS_01297 [Pyricularia sp. CBS 133598]